MVASEPLSDTFGYGVAASRPAAGIAGRVYYATDTQVLSRDNGSSWDTLTLVSGGAAFAGCRAQRTTDQGSITTGTDTPVVFDAADVYDTDGFHDPSTNASRITIPTGLGGKYLLTSAVVWDTNTTNVRQCYFRINGSGIAGSFNRVPAGTAYVAQVLSDVLDLAQGDYVEVVVFQDSGSSRTITATLIGAIYFSATKQ